MDEINNDRVLDLANGIHDIARFHKQGGMKRLKMMNRWPNIMNILEAILGAMNGDRPADDDQFKNAVSLLTEQFRIWEDLK